MMCALLPIQGTIFKFTDTYWGSAGLNYYQIPITQVAPIDFEAALLMAEIIYKRMLL